jgi:hypothetical protein
VGPALDAFWTLDPGPRHENQPFLWIYMAKNHHEAAKIMILYDDDLWGYNQNTQCTKNPIQN